MQVDDRIGADIKLQLNLIERNRQVKVLYAAEAGSRAWGFQSHDSDYDIRFVYIPRYATHHYLKLDKGRDVIEMIYSNSDYALDLVGWDIKKALTLFRKLNPNFIEWMLSPIRYVQESHNGVSLTDSLLSCICPNIVMQGTKPPYIVSRAALMMHYFHMAMNNFREYLRGDTVWTKKYLYVIRPLLACTWIEFERTPPPVWFDALLMNVSELLVEKRKQPESDVNDLVFHIQELVQRKKNGDELSEGPRIDALHNFISIEMHHFNRVAKAEPGMDRDEHLAFTCYLEGLFYQLLDIGEHPDESHRWQGFTMNRS